MTSQLEGESVLGRMTRRDEKTGPILRTMSVWICQKYGPCEKERWQVIRLTKVGQPPWVVQEQNDGF